jgi:hypothetical protein
MKLAEILKQYKEEWMLIEYTKLDEELKVVEGQVLAHSPRKEDLYALSKAVGNLYLCRQEHWKVWASFIMLERKP